MDYNEIDIVIVEDNPDDAELMLRSLKKINLINKLIVLEDGEQALDFIFCRGRFNNRNMNYLPKAIFLDLKLPKIDGIEVLKEIKSDERTKKIPVIIVSSSKDDPDIHLAYQFGANSYVVKPVNFETFVKTLSQIGLYWLVINENAK